MTTDEKTDSKPNESQTSGSITTTTTTTTESNNEINISLNINETKDECIDSKTKIAVIETDLTNESISQINEQNQEEMQTNDECLKDCHNLIDNKNGNSDENECVERAEVNTNSTYDVVMKNSESVENLTQASASIPFVSESAVNFKLIYNKSTFDINIGLNKSVFQLKEYIQTITSVAPSMQKLCFRGILNDSKTLCESGIKDGVKVMLIGSTITDVIAVNLTTKEDIKEEKAQSSTKEPLCKLKQHKKIIDKGLPTDAMPAWKNGSAPLPPEPLHGMVNKYGNKVRLTFKLEQDQLWVGTRERTEKLSMMSVRTIISEPIEGHPEYHIMGIQTGPTEASRIWIYWVPAQFIEAIKDTILGK